MVTKEQFNAYCGNIFTAEDKQKYVKTRQTRKLSLIISLSIEAVLAVVLWFVAKNRSAIFGVPFIMLVTVLIILAVCKVKVGDLSKKYGTKIIDYLLKDYNHTYMPNSIISSNIFAESHFARGYTKYTGEDLLSVTIPNDDGTPSNVTLNICDLKLSHEETRTRTVTDANGHHHTETYTETVIDYNGCFGYINFPFQFKCNLTLNNNIGMEKIKLEDIAFNKTFSVRTDNQIEALRVLTPSMMTKLTQFSKRVGRLRFYLKQNGSLYFGSSGNLFQTSSKSKTLTGEVFADFYDDISSVLKIVEEIKNNNKIFKM